MVAPDDSSSLHHAESSVASNTAAILENHSHPNTEETIKRHSNVTMLDTPRRWRRAVFHTVQETISRIPPLPSELGPIRRKKSTQEKEGKKDEKKISERTSKRSTIQENLQSSIDFVTVPIRSLPMPFVQRKRSNVERTRQSRPRSRPLHKITDEDDDLAEALLKEPSIRELIALNAAVVVEQSSYDFVAMILSYYSTGMEAMLAIFVFFLPCHIFCYYWRGFTNSWAVQRVASWLCFFHSLPHRPRRRPAQSEGRSQHTDAILAAGAVFAVYNASMQTQPPPRRPKCRKQRDVCN